MSARGDDLVATIDIGTNTVLLLVAKRGGGGVEHVLDRAEITRLGKGVDREGRLSPASIDATLAAIDRHVREARALGAARIAAVGTSALRDAANARDFLARAAALLGSEVEVISGAREAELTFRGALDGIPLADEVVTAFDVGGGSTEIICGRTSPIAIEHATSLQIGSVRLFERHATDAAQPVAPSVIDAIAADVRRALATVTFGPKGPLVGIAGTVTTIAAIARDVDPYDARRIHGARITIDELRRVTSELAAMTLDERRRVRGLEPARADVIVAGAVLVRCVLEWAGAVDLVVSDGGVRVGLAAELLRSRDRPDLG